MNLPSFQALLLLKHPEETAQRVFELLAPIFKKLDNLDLQYRQVAESIRDFHNDQKLFYDPSGRKIKWVGLLENAVGMPGMGTGMMVPQDYDYEMDAMNFRKREWIHPCDITLKSNESFEDLLKKGINSSLVLMSMYEDYLKDRISADEILDYIGNRTFDTGMEPGTPMKYFRKALEK